MLTWIWKRRPGPRAGAPRARLHLEALERRLVPSSPQPVHPDGGPPSATVYVETNDPAPGQNAVLAFRQEADGSLRAIGSFRTGGTGQLNLPKVVGPDDSSQEVVATPDGRYLFAVNQGSGTVTSFRVRGDGRLDRVGTFSSGGVQPDSIGVVGDHLYVANRGDAAVGHPGTVAPNVTGFTIRPDGRLDPVPGSTVSFPVGTTVAQALVSPDGRFLFADLFGVPGSTAPEGNTLAPFQIEPDGSLQAAPGGAVGAPVSPALLLGSDAHPDLPIVYAGLTGVNRVGVFTYDSTGRLTYAGSVAGQGAGPCWVVVSADGKYLYTGDTGSNSVGVFSLADPLHPVQVQEFALGGPHAPPGSPAGTLQTNAFQLALSPDGRSLYVIGQSTNPTGAFPDGNQLHTLSVGPDGTLSEPNGPVVLSGFGVPGNAHPQGIAVVAHRGGGDDRGDGSDGAPR